MICLGLRLVARIKCLVGRHEGFGSGLILLWRNETTKSAAQSQSGEGTRGKHDIQRLGDHLDQLASGPTGWPP